MAESLRLDKYLADMGIGSRSEVKVWIRKKRVKVNGEICRNAETKVNIASDEIRFNDAIVNYSEFVYYMLNKPVGVVSATRDNCSKTVLDLIKEKHGKELFPVGRLDKDTEGLLLITNDGDMAHQLLSPKKHVDKVYYAKVKGIVSEEDQEEFQKGVNIGDDYITLPAKLDILQSADISEIELTIREGKFHQVKRMFEAVGKEVIYLKRLSMGGLQLDSTLASGEYRKLTMEEIAYLKGLKKNNILSDIDAVIFDLDGTLVDSMWMWESIDFEYLKCFGITLPADLQKCIEGKSFSETAIYFKERFQLPDSLEQIKSAWNQMAWDKYSKEVPLKEGVRELLDYLKDHNISAGIATSNSRELVELIIEKHKLQEHFTSVRTSCEVEKGKPSPDIYLLVAQDLKAEPSRCLVFEDIIQGIMAGKNANMKVCAVYDKYSEKERKLKESMADYYVDSIVEVLGNAEE